jgi:hypothetical protein
MFLCPNFVCVFSIQDVLRFRSFKRQTTSSAEGWFLTMFDFAISRSGVRQTRKTVFSAKNEVCCHVPGPLRPPYFQERRVVQLRGSRNTSTCAISQRCGSCEPKTARFRSKNDDFLTNFNKNYWKWRHSPLYGHNPRSYSHKVIAHSDPSQAGVKRANKFRFDFYGVSIPRFKPDLRIPIWIFD